MVGADLKPDPAWTGEMRDQNRVLGLNGCALDNSFKTLREAQMAAAPGSRRLTFRKNAFSAKNKELLHAGLPPVFDPIVD